MFTGRDWCTEGFHKGKQAKQVCKNPHLISADVGAVKLRVARQQGDREGFRAPLYFIFYVSLRQYYWLIAEDSTSRMANDFRSGDIDGWWSYVPNLLVAFIICISVSDRSIEILSY